MEFADLRAGDVIQLNGRDVVLVEDPVGRPTWRVAVKDVEPREYSVGWHSTQKALRLRRGDG